MIMMMMMMMMLMMVMVMVIMMMIMVVPEVQPHPAEVVMETPTKVKMPGKKQLQAIGAAFLLEADAACQGLKFVSSNPLCLVKHLAFKAPS